MIRLSEYLPNLTPASPQQLSELADRSKKDSLIKYALKSEFAEWYIHHGDLLIPHDICNDISLVVMGDVIVHGCYDDYACLQTGSIVCFGNMWAENIFSWGAIFVERNLFVDGLLHTVYNDHSFEVGETLFARVAIVDDKASNDPRQQCEIYAADQALNSEELEEAVTKCKKVMPLLMWDADSDEDNGRLPDFNRTRAFYYQGEKLFLKSRQPPKKVGSEEDFAGKLLSRKDTSAEQLAAIANDQKRKFIVAVHPSCTSELLEVFASDTDQRIRWAAASHPNSSETALEKLSLDSDETLRLAVAMNPATSSSVLDALSLDQSELVRGAVAHRKVQKEHIEIVLPTLEDYRKDDERTRRAYEQQSEKEPEPNLEELEKLMCGPVEKRRDVARAAIGSEGLFEIHHKIRDGVLERLMLDASPKVREIASCAWLQQDYYEKNEQRLLDDEVSDIRFVLALRTRSAGTLLRLVNDSSLEVRCAALMNPNAPEELLTSAADRLNPSKDSEETIELMSSFMQNLLLPPHLISTLYKKLPAGMLARHSNSPIDVIAKQISLEYEKINPKLSREISVANSAEDLFTLFLNSNVPELLAIAAVNRHTPNNIIMDLHKKASTNEPLRWALAANPCLPDELFREYANDDVRVRINVASNPSCPTDILRSLAKNDDMNVVKQAARLNLQKLHGEDTD